MKGKIMTYVLDLQSTTEVADDARFCNLISFASCSICTPLSIASVALCWS